MTNHFLPDLFLSALIIISAGCNSSQAQSSTQYNVSSWTSIAVKGYDVVAYFNEGKPMKGRKQFQWEWQGAKWRFASESNMALFQADPTRYAPQYGGYCAYAMSRGETAGIDPHAWRIVDGKLYLNYDAGIQKEWESAMGAYIDSADAHWPKVRDKLRK